MSTDKHIHVFNIPSCWNPDSILAYFGPTFAIISLLPLTMVFVSLSLIYKGNKIRTIILSISTHVLLYASHLAQLIIKEKRPYPECSSFLISEYGLPSPEFVYTISITTKILFYVIWFKENRSILKIFGILLTLFVYGLAYYLAYLASMKQIIISMTIGFGMTVFICWFLEQTLFRELRQIKKKTWKCFFGKYYKMFYFN